MIFITSCYTDNPSINDGESGEGDKDTENGENTDHTHSFGDWIVSFEATCTNNGMKERTCQCGEKESEIIDALGHTEIVDPAVEETCTETGLTQGKHCSVCGEVMIAQTVTPTKEHTESDWIIDKQATLDEQGLRHTECTVCGKYLMEEYYSLVASSGLEFKLNSDGNSYYVSGIGSCTDTDIVIPRVYNGLPVSRIGYHAFEFRTKITSIIIPDSVTSIGNDAFSYCKSLTNIIIPDSVTNIGEYTFSGCYSLSSITIPNSVTSIDDWAFFNCNSLTKITIPDSVTSIGVEAFASCDSLTSITIPDSVTSIGIQAFASCGSLASITIGDSVNSIGHWAFVDCDLLISIEVNKNNNYYKSIDGNLYSKDGATLIHYTKGKPNTSFTIPDFVTSIGEWAFYTCDSLTSITIPNSVTNIGDHAFHECSSLTGITIPNSVTGIGNGAFMYCKSLTNITIPDSVNIIGIDTFYDCKSLTSVTIPDSVNSIGAYAFYNCSALTSITIPDSVTSIGNGAFEYCTSLTSITIPDSVTNICYGVFFDCDSLTSINFSGTVSQWSVIEKGLDWDNGTGEYTVYCIDGKITKSGTVTYY